MTPLGITPLGLRLLGVGCGVGDSTSAKSFFTTNDDGVGVQSGGEARGDKRVCGKKGEMLQAIEMGCRARHAELAERCLPR